MFVIAALIGTPILAALLLLVFRGDKVRTVVVIAAAALLVVLALVLTMQYLFQPSGFVVPHAELFNYLALGIDLICCLYIIYRGIRTSNFLAIFLAGIQALLVIFYELSYAHQADVAIDLSVDQLSLIMVLVIAVIGGGICIFAIGYMRDYQEHLENEGRGLAISGEPSRVAEVLKRIRDRRHIFFAIIFIFLGAMFAVVLSNRLSWLLTAWEVTTVCSFALIGYTRTEEATKNSFRAVAINLAGGMAFTTALIMLAGGEYQILELDQLIAVGVGGTLLLPVMLIAFAGMTKAAQMPFQNWLLGAMVAPTPVSALLHSSTMVKAGVFIIIKLAPVLGWNVPGLFVLVVGGLSFLGCSALAVSQSGAKRVLAYSTVANLGLIVCCAGVGTPEAAWAAIFLLVFHAAAKALLFCSVGTAEHRIGGRSIEQMDNIFVRMPWLATCLALGMMAMFIAPFGMLISKWAALVSIADSGHFELLFVLAFGSAITFVIWAKWLGKVLSVGNEDERVRTKVSLPERFSLGALALLLICITLCIPYLSELFVMPYLQMTGLIYQVPSWILASDVLGYDNLMIMSIIFLVMLALLVVQIFRRRPAPNDTVYMAGVGAHSEKRSYYNAFGDENLATQRNWYLRPLFGERQLGRRVTVLMGVVMGLFFMLGFIAEMML